LLIFDIIARTISHKTLFFSYYKSTLADLSVAKKKKKKKTVSQPSLAAVSGHGRATRGAGAVNATATGRRRASVSSSISSRRSWTKGKSGHIDHHSPRNRELHFALRAVGSVASRLARHGTAVSEFGNLTDRYHKRSGSPVPFCVAS
jgi:hypothetical protein